MKKKKMSKKKIVAIVILVVIIGIIAIKVLSPKEVVINNIEIVSLEKRDIANSISATGTIGTTTSSTVAATAQGYTVKKVYVQEGDVVEAGDVICEFDMSAMQTTYALTAKSGAIAQTQASIGVNSARRSLDDAIKNRDTQNSNAQQAVDKTKDAHDTILKQLDTIGNSIKTLEPQVKAIKPAEDAYNKALSEYNTAKTKYNATLAQVSTPDSLKLVGEVNEFDSSKLDTTIIGANEVQQAYNNYLTAKIAYDQVAPLKQQYDGLVATKAQLEGQLNQAKSAYDQAVSAKDSASNQLNTAVATLQDQVTNSELAVQSAANASKLQLSNYSEQIKKGKITAPVSGTVTSLNVQEGDVYMGPSVCSINGTESLMIEANIDEYDIPDVKVGMEVYIKTDATREEELTGTITYVANASTGSTAAGGSAYSAMGVTSTNATYKIEITLDEQNPRLRLGMNAKLSIITDKVENAWAVPYDAVYEREDGTHYIEIAKNDEGTDKYELDVEKGIEGSYYTEVKSEKLQDGMKVVLPIKETQDTIEKLVEIMGSRGGM